MRQIECTINGIGERAGNASLEEIVMALRVRSDRLPYSTTVIESTLLFPTSQLLSQLTRRTGPGEQGHRRPQRVRARGGHPSGRHAEGLADLRDHAAAGRRPDTPNSSCSAVTPGGTPCSRRCETLGLGLTTEELALVYQEVVSLGEHRKSIGDNDLRRIVDRVRSGREATQATH